MRVGSINFFRTSRMCSDCKKYFLQSGAEKFNCPSQFGKFDSPFCSPCVIFVILIRIYRMGESVHARERAREGFAVAKGKTGSAVLLQSYPVYVIPVQSRPVLVQVSLEVRVALLVSDMVYILQVVS